MGLTNESPRAILGSIGLVIGTYFLFVFLPWALSKRQTDDGKVVAAKNTLLTIMKECEVKQRKIGSTDPAGIQSARVSLDKYEINLGATCYEAHAKPKENHLPYLMISVDPGSGLIEKRCVARQKGSGYCYVDKTSLSIEQKAGELGYW